METIASNDRDLLDLTMRSTTAIIAARSIFLDRYIQYKGYGLKIYILVSPDTALSHIVPIAPPDRTSIPGLGGGRGDGGTGGRGD